MSASQTGIRRRLQPFRASKKPQSSAHLCPIRGANLHAGFGDFRICISFRKTARVPQFCGVFVLIGIGPDKQCPMKLQRVLFNGWVRPVQPHASQSGRSNSR